jgi:flavorubredoxin
MMYTEENKTQEMNEQAAETVCEEGTAVAETEYEEGYVSGGEVLKKAAVTTIVVVGTVTIVKGVCKKLRHPIGKLLKKIGEALDSDGNKAQTEVENEPDVYDAEYEETTEEVNEE